MIFPTVSFPWSQSGGVEAQSRSRHVGRGHCGDLSLVVGPRGTETCIGAFRGFVVSCGALIWSFSFVARSSSSSNDILISFLFRLASVTADFAAAYSRHHVTNLSWNPPPRHSSTQASLPRSRHFETLITGFHNKDGLIRLNSVVDWSPFLIIRVAAS